MKALTGITTGVNKAELARVLSVVIGVALLTLSAKIQVPFWPVPLTMQSAVVLMLPCVLGLRAGMVSIALYLGFGAAGYPVFASASIPAGLAYFAGPTGGFLLGFVAAAIMIGTFYERSSYRNWFPALLGMMVVGHAVILGFGTLWLAYGVPSLGMSAAFAAGVMPFLWGSVIKSLLAALCTAGLTVSRR